TTFSGWSTPALVAVRVAAVLSTAVGTVAAIEEIWRASGVIHGLQTSPLPFVLIAAGFFVLAADLAVGLPIMLAGLLLFGAPDVALARLAPGVFRAIAEDAALYTDGMFLFYGPFGRLAWI